MLVSGNSKEFEHPTPGTVRAVCTRVVDLGTQETNGQTGKKKNRKVMLSWEIDEAMADGRPFLVSERYNVNINPKAWLGQLLESWRGKPFTDEQLESFNLSAVLGSSCLLTIVRKGDYTNVIAAIPLVKGMPKLEAKAKYIDFDLDNFSKDVYDSLGDKLKETIAKSPEYIKATGQKDDAAPGKDEQDHPSSEPDIPF
jgi:hypothetical protein